MVFEKLLITESLSSKKDPLLPSLCVYLERLESWLMDTSLLLKSFRFSKMIYQTILDEEQSPFPLCEAISLFISALEHLLDPTEPMS